jgi:predicted permease
METLLQDVRFAVRVLTKNPGFAVIAILTLAIGIGANTTIFSVVNGVLLNPLSFPQPERLVRVYDSTDDFSKSSVSYLNFKDWERGNRTFAYMTGFRGEDLNVTGGDEPEQVTGELVSASYFNTLGIQPTLGRSFTDAEDQAGGPPAAILTYGFWKKQFGGDPKILDRSVTLNGKSYNIVGVLPPDFHAHEQAKIFTPLAQADKVILQDRELRWGIHVLGRLKPGVTVAEASADMESIRRNLQKQFPKATAKAIALVQFKQDMVGDIRPILLVLLGAVAFVLLIACANVANLLLARSAARKREFAIRTSVGASSGRIVRQLLTESALLSVCAGLLGIGIAYWGTDAALRLAPGSVPRMREIHIDMHVLLFVLGASLLTGILFGLAPALHAMRQNIEQALRDGGRGSSSDRRIAQNIFVTSELGLALILLIGAGLMIRTLGRLWSVDPGFDPHKVVTMQVALSPKLGDDADNIRAAYRRLLERVRSIAGVESAGVTALVPLSGDDSEIPVWPGTGPEPPVNQQTESMMYIVDPAYANTMKIPLLRGRFLTDQDVHHSPLSVVIDESFAKQFFRNDDPIGKQVSLKYVGAGQIVGIVGHVKHWGLDSEGKEPIAAQLYFALDQVPDAFMSTGKTGLTIVLRTNSDPAGITQAVRREVMGADKDQPVYNVATFEQIISDSIAARRFAMTLLTSFASVALLLAAIGIYGVFSYAVTQRTQEIGVRMALGARTENVLALIFRGTVGLVAVAVIGGLAASFGLMRLLRDQLYGISAADLPTYVAVPLVLIAVAVLATYLPARRATKVDPVVALRYE